MASCSGFCVSGVSPSAAASALSAGGPIDERPEGVVEIRHPLVVLGGDRDRLAETEGIGIESAGAGLALGLVGHQHGRPPVPAQPVREVAIERRDAGAGVDEKEHRIGLRQRLLGLLLHARREGLGRGLVEARGIQHAEAEIAQARLALAPVAGDAGLIVDQRQAPPDETVEECRLPHVGTADDGHRCGHGALGNNATISIT